MLTDRIQGVLSSVAIKAPCRVATSSNITLSGFQTIGSITLTEADPNLRVFVRSQTNAVENGIYNAKSGAWERTADFSGSRDVVQGTLVPVNTTSGFVFYRITTADPVVIGTSNITSESADVLEAIEAVSDAEAARDAALAAQAAAEAAAVDAALNSTERLTGTSTTSVAIGTGSKSFTTQEGKFFDVGMFLLISSDANPSTNWMFGQSTAYSGTSLTVNVLSVGGSGTLTDWTIRVSGARGAVGETGASGAGSGDLVSTNNLDDVANASTARTNLGLAIGTNVQAYDADTAKTDVAQEWTASQNFNEAAITSTSNSVAWNCATSQCAFHDLTENTTIAEASNTNDGGFYSLTIKQHASAAKTVGWHASYLAPTGTMPTMTATLSKRDIYTFKKTNGSMILVGSVQAL